MLGWAPSPHLLLATSYFLLLTSYFLHEQQARAHAVQCDTILLLPTSYFLLPTSYLLGDRWAGLPCLTAGDHCSHFAARAPRMGAGLQSEVRSRHDYFLLLTSHSSDGSRSSIWVLSVRWQLRSSCYPRQEGCHCSGRTPTYPTGSPSMSDAQARFALGGWGRVGGWWVGWAGAGVQHNITKKSVGWARHTANSAGPHLGSPSRVPVSI